MTEYCCAAGQANSEAGAGQVERIRTGLRGFQALMGLQGLASLDKVTQLERLLEQVSFQEAH